MLTKCEEDIQRRGSEKFSGYSARKGLMDTGLILAFARVIMDTKRYLIHRGDIPSWPQFLNVNSRRLSWSCSYFSGLSQITGAFKQRAEAQTARGSYSKRRYTFV